MESQDRYSTLFKDKTKYNVIMSVLVGMIYLEMKNTLMAV